MTKTKKIIIYIIDLLSMFLILFYGISIMIETAELGKLGYMFLLLVPILLCFIFILVFIENPKVFNILSISSYFISFILLFIIGYVNNKSNQYFNVFDYAIMPALIYTLLFNIGTTINLFIYNISFKTKEVK